MTTMKLNSLTQLGLTEREIAVYHSLLTLGPASIRDLAAKAQLNRGTTYETLKILVSKGIVNYLPKGKRRVFQAEDPERLLDLAEQKRQSLEQTLLELKTDIIPGLKHLKTDMVAGNVRFYEGDDGVELILRDILSSVDRSKQKQYSVISTQALREHLYRPFPTFTKQRVAKNIKVRVIAIGDGGDEAELAERKWLKGKGDASYIAIYPPKVAMISLADNNYPVVVVIDSDAIAGTQQMMFDTLWAAL
ncbi:MAG: sugar-specific transcriptional regulator TrmB [Bermanella sp.]|jgi:sugar-specific transcriptional regulator TrmB